MRGRVVTRPRRLWRIIRSHDVNPRRQVQALVELGQSSDDAERMATRSRFPRPPRALRRLVLRGRLAAAYSAYRTGTARADENAGWRPVGLAELASLAATVRARQTLRHARCCIGLSHGWTQTIARGPQRALYLLRGSNANWVRSASPRSTTRSARTRLTSTPGREGDLFPRQVHQLARCARGVRNALAARGHGVGGGGGPEPACDALLFANVPRLSGQH